MKNLQLPLTRQWFEMTELGVKLEDYREVTPYWCSRLLLDNGEHKSAKWWKYYYSYGFRGTIERMIYLGEVSFKEFESNIMTLGYPKSTDTSRILTLKHEGIEIREGNPDWGAEPGKIYFVIKHEV